jgi:hypothetical protein
MRKTTKDPPKSQSRSEAMKRAWANRRASAAQTDEAIELVSDTTPAVVAVPAVEANPAVEPDRATQPELAHEPDLAHEPEVTFQPALTPAPVPAVESDSTAQPVSTAVQPDSLAAWIEHPVCLCGCSESLVRSTSEARQSLFKPGHDSRLKSLAARVVKGTASPDEIPAIARALQERIGFLKSRPELAAAFR